MKNFVMTMLVIGLLAGSASAAIVTLDLVADPGGTGTWGVYASVSLGDNEGLAIFDLDVVGSGGLTVDSSVNESPKGTAQIDFSQFFPYGFSELRSDGTAGLGVSAGQPTIYQGANDPQKDSLVLQGVGQTAGSYTPVPPLGHAGPAASWGAPVLLASGTYSGLGTLSASAGAASWGVLASGSAWSGPGNVELAQEVIGDQEIIPEPATMLILLGGVLAGLIRRR